MHLDFKQINNIPVDCLYVLDASAILNNPQIEEYDVKEPSCFIVIPAFLNELDGLKNSKNREEAVTFFKKILEYSKKGKFLDGCEIKNNVFLKFVQIDLEAKDGRYDWLNDSYVDKKILCTALKLKENTDKAIYIVSADSLLKILCDIEEIGYIYVAKKEYSSSSSTMPGIPPIEMSLKSKESKSEVINNDVLDVEIIDKKIEMEDGKKYLFY